MATNMEITVYFYKYNGQNIICGVLLPGMKKPFRGKESGSLYRAYMKSIMMPVIKI